MPLPIMHISKERLSEMLADPKLVVIDLRVNWKHSRHKIKSAVHEDARDVTSWAAKYDRDRAIVLYCSAPDEKTSAEVARSLMQKGFADVRVLRGGWAVWEAAELPIERTAKMPLPEGIVRGILSD